MRQGGMERHAPVLPIEQMSCNSSLFLEVDASCVGHNADRISYSGGSGGQKRNSCVSCHAVSVRGFESRGSCERSGTGLANETAEARRAKSVETEARGQR